MNYITLFISIFNITEENIKFELYTDIIIEFTIMGWKDELEDFFNFEDITPKHIQDEKLGPYN